MEIKLSPNFELALKLLETEEQNRLFQSFFTYCTGSFFNYSSIPRKDEFIDVEDIMWEWAEKNYNDSAREIVNELWPYVRTELRVLEVTHNRSYISVSCTDLYRIE